MSDSSPQFVHRNYKQIIENNFYINNYNQSIYYWIIFNLYCIHEYYLFIIYHANIVWLSKFKLGYLWGSCKVINKCINFLFEIKFITGQLEVYTMSEQTRMANRLYIVLSITGSYLTYQYDLSHNNKLIVNNYYQYQIKLIIINIIFNLKNQSFIVYKNKEWNIL